MARPPSGHFLRETLPDVVVVGQARPPIEAHRIPVLVILTGPQLGERKRLESAIEIGRDPDADLVLRDGDVAWRHARVTPSTDGWIVHDLGTAERGVEVNGMRVARFLLSADDRVQLGSTVLRFELHDTVELAFDAAVEERLWRDDLTGLSSRRRFEHDLGARLDAARAGGETVGLAVLDLDELKQINDRHGHLVGARVIAEVGKALGAALPPGALACRLGGDEYAVAVIGVDLEAMEEIAGLLRDRIATLALRHDGEDLWVGISAGVAVGPAQGGETFALLRSADDALLRAKRSGRAQVRR